MRRGVTVVLLVARDIMDGGGGPEKFVGAYLQMNGQR